VAEISASFNHCGGGDVVAKLSFQLEKLGLKNCSYVLNYVARVQKQKFFLKNHVSIISLLPGDF
jgi:hypothetical protein